MTLPKWKTAVTQWDVLVLGGITMPGVWAITIKPSRKVQIDASKELNGTTLTDNGYNGAKVTGKGRLWTDAQVDEFYRLLPFFHPRKPDGVSAPTTIVHPLATLYGVRAIYIPEWNAATPGAEFLTVSFSAVEWFPAPEEPAPAPVPRPATGGGGGGGGDDDGEFVPQGPPAPDPGLSDEDFVVPDPNEGAATP